MKIRVIGNPNPQERNGKMDKIMEKIICAAIWYNDGKKRANLPRNIQTGVVIGGWRHGNCIIPLNTCFPNREYILKNEDGNVTIQGFLTSMGNFVTREEAADIAFKAGQIPENIAKIKFLFSEDLY